MLKGQHPDYERSKRTHEIAKERNCSLSTARYYYELETGVRTRKKAYVQNGSKYGIVNNKLGRNQRTKDLSDEEILKIRAEKKAIKEEWHQEALRKNALKENHSKEVQKRARTIKDLKYYIAVAHKNYKESGSDKDRAIWKECIQAKKDFINKNPKITLQTKASNV